ncbi:nuclear transport factor 2 family protein [Hydrocarboniphaga sp.]|uniref:nuclear transport factor 2 family protein n=1 Tax=Hydrocarboniphaga sp. TaxID=2033016 RepID=UPI003D0AEBBC
MDTDSQDITAQLQDLLARDTIRRCIVQLARGEDRRQGELIRASYWPDSTTDYGVFKGSFPQYFDWVIPGSPAIPNTQHVLGQSYIELEGDQARVETQLLSYHRVDMGSQQRDVCIGGRYLDLMQQRGGDWKIAQRTMLYDWYQDWGVAIDWSQGVMGMPFSAEHFSGRAHGDFSLGFFAGP